MIAPRYSRDSSARGARADTTGGVLSWWACSRSPLRSAKARTALALAAGLAVVACAHGIASLPADATARPASDVPERFVSAAAAPANGAPPVCRNPLLDPRDGTRLELVRSTAGTRGDYEVTAGRYGVGPRELLRVDCTTGAAIGVVRR